MREEILARIPQENPNHVLEVALLHDSAERSRIELRSLWWSAGLALPSARPAHGWGRGTAAREAATAPGPTGRGQDEGWEDLQGRRG